MRSIPVCPPLCAWGSWVLGPQVHCKWRETDRETDRVRGSVGYLSAHAQLLQEHGLPTGGAGILPP